MDFLLVQYINRLADKQLSIYWRQKYVQYLDTDMVKLDSKKEKEIRQQTTF